MLKYYLLEKYRYNEPILLNDLKIDILSENAVRHSVKFTKEQLSEVSYVITDATVKN